MYFNYWWNTNYTIKALLLTLSLIILLFITFLIIFSALRKLKEESEKKLIIPTNLDDKNLFNYLTKNLKLHNTYLLANFLETDSQAIKKLIKEENYKILNQLIINKYEKS